MDHKAQVLIVVDYINNNSGVSSVVMNYYSHIDHSKVQMDFLLYEMPEENFLQYLQNHGSKVYCSGYPMKIGIRNYQKEIENFFKELEDEYSIVHVHIPNAAFVVLKYAKRYGVNTRIMHSHNSRGADGVLKKIRNYILNKQGIFYANQYFACSKAAGEYLYGRKRNQQVTIINNAIDLKKYSFCPESRDRIRKELEIGDEIVLGHVGRFSEQKNHKFLIEIANQLKTQKINFKLLLLGSGELQDQIKEQVEKSGLEKIVIFAGIVNNVKEYMDAMDIFLLPSLYEGLPCVCVEAQANGLPCFLSESITGEVALADSVHFLEISKASIWADMIIEMLNSKQQKRNHGEKNQYIGLNQYDIAIQAKILEERYLSYGNSSNINVNI